jgi:hypothetical protein
MFFLRTAQQSTLDIIFSYKTMCIFILLLIPPSFHVPDNNQVIPFLSLEVQGSITFYVCLIPAETHPSIRYIWENSWQTTQEFKTSCFRNRLWEIDQKQSGSLQGITAAVVGHNIPNISQPISIGCRLKSGPGNW